MTAKKATYTRTCLACGDDHETTRPKATRCKPCVDQGNKAKAVTCPGCDTKFPKIDDDQFCRSCRALPSGQITEMILELDLAKEAEDRKLRDAKRRRDAVAQQLAELERLGNRPKGYPEMTKKTAESAIGVLWLNLCATEGATHVLLNDRDVDDDTKGRLMTTYLRLVLKGFTSEAVAKVDPVALMGRDMAEVDKAISELPKVDPEEDDDHTAAFDPFEGIDENMREEIEAFQERQRHREMEQRLGLAS
jgi:hypothetical protein